MKKKLNELEFWGMQYFYEFYCKEYDHDQKKAFDRLTQEFGVDKVEDYKLKCGDELDRKVEWVSKGIGRS